MIATENNAEQRSLEWHTARAGRATASKFNTVVVAGTGADTYLAELIGERISGYVTETFQSFDMREGTEREEIARLEYELKTGYTVRTCGFFAHNELMCGASPDGLISDDGLVEFKSPKENTHLKTLHTGKIPNQYYWQMVGQMWMTERNWCDYVSYHPKFGDASLFIKRVERNEADVQQLQDAVKRFLAKVDQEEQFVRAYNGQPNQVTVTRIKR